MKGGRCCQSCQTDVLLWLPSILRIADACHAPGFFLTGPRRTSWEQIHEDVHSRTQACTQRGGALRSGFWGGGGECSLLERLSPNRELDSSVHLPGVTKCKKESCQIFACTLQGRERPVHLFSVEGGQAKREHLRVVLIRPTLKVQW